MKRLILASGWIFFLSGCDRGLTDKFDVPSAKIEGMDDAALPEDIQAKLSEIDQTLARIDSQLDQRLGAIERRLLNVEQGAGGPGAGGLNAGGFSVVGEADGQVPTGDQPTAEPVAVEETASAFHATADEHEYVGPSLCAPCHLPQYTSWKKTKMANAFESLKPGMAADAKLQFNLDPNKDYTKVSVCVGCHVTGYGKQGGFVDIETTPDLAGVTCEACHGPAGSYMAKGLKKNPPLNNAKTAITRIALWSAKIMFSISKRTSKKGRTSTSHCNSNTNRRFRLWSTLFDVVNRTRDSNLPPTGLRTALLVNRSWLTCQPVTAEVNDPMVGVIADHYFVAI
jgi:hypothetical protein